MSTDDQTLIIPGAELVRFYFGTSSTLIKRLISAPFKEEMLWQKRITIRSAAIST